LPVTVSLPLPLFVLAGALSLRRGGEFDQCLIAPVAGALLASLLWLAAYWTVFASGHGRAVNADEVQQFYANCFTILFLFPMAAFGAGLVGGLAVRAYRSLGRTTPRGPTSETKSLQRADLR
jgi:hypothetical protein